jgi:hypothetical protein
MVKGQYPLDLMFGAERRHCSPKYDMEWRFDEIYTSSSKSRTPVPSWDGVDCKYKGAHWVGSQKVNVRLLTYGCGILLLVRELPRLVLRLLCKLYFRSHFYF